MADHRPRTPRPSRAARPDDTGAPAAGTRPAPPSPIPTSPPPSPPSAFPPSCARSWPATASPRRSPSRPPRCPTPSPGRDVLGRGRTGSGKTLAFALPVLTRLGRRPPRPQAGPPPRADPGADPRAGHPDRRRHRPAGQAPRPAHHHHLRRRRPEPAGRTPCATASTSSSPAPAASRTSSSQGHCDLDAVEITVLDEADHMADLGFLPGGQAPPRPHARRRPAHALLGHARQGHRRPREALPHRPGHPQRRLRAVAGRTRWPTTCCT